MNIPSLHSRRLLLIAGAIAATLGSASIASASDELPPRMKEESPQAAPAQFERAQRTDMESFRDYDVETFRAVHHR